MPYRIRKRTDSGRKPFKIQAQQAGGGWKTVGSSTSKRKAKASAGVRVRKERGG